MIVRQTSSTQTGTAQGAERSQQDENLRMQAQNSLLESLGAVQAAIESMPELSPRNARDAFMRTDPLLTMLNKQILEARANMAKIAASFGLGDVMLEALTLQVTALEAAYAARLAMLARKREESTRRQQAAERIWADDKTLRDVRSQQQTCRRRHNGALWLLAFLMARGGMTSARISGHIPNAA